MDSKLSTEFLISIKEEYDREINTLNNIISIKQDRLDEINDILATQCIHDWQTDYVDVDVERSEIIKYCKNCKLNYGTVMLIT
jgi:hypothetical protein